MNQTRVLIYVTIIVMALSIGYRLWAVQQHSYIFIALTTQEYKSQFLGTAKQVNLNRHFSSITQKSF